jgi:hypothetical protein
MEPISEEEYQKTVYPILMKIFNESIFHITENILYPFTKKIEASAFLYTYDVNYQVFGNVLRDEILKLGDNYIYDIFVLDESCSTTKLQYGEDCEMGDSGYTATFSASGTWGLYQYMEGIAFLGGSQSFINAIRQSFPEMDRQFSNFLECWKDMNYYADNSWLPELLLQIYGEEKAKELLEEAQEMGVYYNLLEE